MLCRCSQAAAETWAGCPGPGEALSRGQSSDVEGELDMDMGTWTPSLRWSGAQRAGQIGGVGMRGLQAETVCWGHALGDTLQRASACGFGLEGKLVKKTMAA